uniref:Kynurenine formamidase n=1 Tax=Cacopsylla melanoneura TaxID=428564 RepID=A0A8D8UQY0_9HEMI
MKSAFILFVGFLGVHFQNAFAFFGANTYRTFSFSRPTDLSFAIDENTVHWDSSQKVSTTRNEIYLPDSTYKSFNKVCFPEHGGTHLDAPSYITKNGRRVADIPIDSLIVSGIHVDVTNEVHGEPKFVLDEHHLRRWTETYGKIESKSVLLINFGWANRYWNRSAYMGTGYSEHNRNFPGISIPAARWIAENPNIVGVGVDTPSVDVGHSTTFDVHKILTGANVYLLENVALNNTYLPARGFQLVVMPMKLTHGTGAPVRIIASPYCIGGAGLVKVSKFAILSMLVVTVLKVQSR